MAKRKLIARGASTAKETARKWDSEGVDSQGTVDRKQAKMATTNYSTHNHSAINCSGPANTFEQDGKREREREEEKWKGKKVRKQ